MIKAKTGVDLPSEEDSIGMETDEVHVTAALSVKKCKREVSYAFT